MNHQLALLLRTHFGVAHPWLEERDERGDVPGWVLVTVMTAGLVMTIWGLAAGQLEQMLKDALDSVNN